MILLKNYNQDFTFSIMSSYKVQLINEEKGIDTILEVRDDEFILDAADQAGLDLPYSCRTGQCVSCTGRILEGEIDDQSNFLKQKEIEAGFFLTCTSSPKSNCVILTHQEDPLLDL